MALSIKLPKKMLFNLVLLLVIYLNIYYPRAISHNMREKTGSIEVCALDGGLLF